MEDGDDDGEQDAAVSLPPLPAGGALAPPLRPALEAPEQARADDQPATAIADPATPPSSQPIPPSDQSAPVQPKAVWKRPAQLPPWRRPSTKPVTASPRLPDAPRVKRPVTSPVAGLLLPPSTNARSKRVPRKIRPRVRPQAQQQPEFGTDEHMAMFVINCVLWVFAIGFLALVIIVVVTA